ncbi:hypothetical protein CgunFtcFv8_008290 [Champsocephalus gunnari]|uniref:Uncharacterized protein n=1 Tax=Champsocephalus gunnari TaxID=52237 RepID=A0AAN8CZW4_CHAGU|nr:hypothetical protein CgunFtcFv8_008290 [Champsocephalus gunnari]
MLSAAGLLHMSVRGGGGVSGHCQPQGRDDLYGAKASARCGVRFYGECRANTQSSWPPLKQHLPHGELNPEPQDAQTPK